MLWIKVFHVFFVVAWFAGLLYLPRLFVYHAATKDENTSKTFKIMERKLFYGIMMPSAVLTLLFGIWLWCYGFTGTWLNLKLIVVALLVVYQAWCFITLRAFKNDTNRHGHVFYRWMNEVPALFLLLIIILVVIKPF